MGMLPSSEGTYRYVTCPGSSRAFNILILQTSQGVCTLWAWTQVGAFHGAALLVSCGQRPQKCLQD